MLVLLGALVLWCHQYLTVTMRSVAEYDVLRGDLAFKEGELEKSRYTAQSLQAEHINLQANLQKVNTK